MNTASMTGIFGSLGGILLLVWGLNWYCQNENPTGWIGNDLCPMAAPLHKMVNSVVQWAAGLFDKGTETVTPVPKPATGQGPVPAGVWDGAAEARLRSCGGEHSDPGGL